jgi:hypothetical protein
MILPLLAAAAFQQGSATIPSDTPVLLRRKVDVSARRQFFMSLKMSMKMDGAGLPKEVTENGKDFTVTANVSEVQSPLSKTLANAVFHVAGMKMVGAGMGGAMPMPKDADVTYSATVDDRSVLHVKKGKSNPLAQFSSLGVAFPDGPVRYGDTWKAELADSSKGGMIPGFKMPSATCTYLGDEAINGVLCHHIGIYADANIGQMMGSAFSLSGGQGSGGLTMTADSYINAEDGDVQLTVADAVVNIEYKQDQTSFNMKMHEGIEMRRVPG